MIIDVTEDGHLVWSGGRVRCALGRGGIRIDKREGDGATPAGLYPLRRVLFRPDRVNRPHTALRTDRIDVADGWCDDAADPRYNRQVRLPYPARHEKLWLEEAIYDVIVVLGHNDAPVVPGAGSAVFLHVARPDYAPTAGCVAVALPDLLGLLTACGPGTEIRIPKPRNS